MPPPNIYQPIRLTETQATALKRYLADEVSAVEEGRSAMVDEWKQAIEDYEAQPLSGSRDFPFEGAANFVIPSIATTVDAIFAREINTVFALKPLWTVQPLNSRWLRHAKPTEQFLEWAQTSVMGMYDATWPWYLETTKLGTGFLKMPWVEDVRHQLTYLPDGSVGFADTTYHLGPRPDYVPIQDMYLPDGDWDVQTAPWIGNKFRLTANQLKSRKKRPFSYEAAAVDAMRPMDIKDPIRQRRDQLEGFQRSRTYEVFEPMELWVDWDVNDDGVDESLVVTWDQVTEGILRVIYAPIVEGRRPYHKACFTRREGRTYGIGVARMLRQLAEAITTQFRQFVDNATLANTRIWKARRGAGIKRGQKLYPGKVLFMGDPKNDLMGEQLGDIYNSQLSVLGALREASERRTGLSDVHLGIESPRVVNRMPATNMLSLLQEGNRRFDLTIRDLRHATAGVGEAALALYQQYRPAGIAYNVVGPDGGLVEAAWQIPRERFKGQLAVVVTATSQSNNRELEKQSLTQLMQLAGGYYQKMVELAALMVNPNVPGEVRSLGVEISKGAGELFRRLLQAYAVQDTDVFVPDVPRILGTLAAQGAEGGPSGRAAGAEGRPAPAGVAGLLPVPGMGGGPAMGGGAAGRRPGGNGERPELG